MIGHTGLPQPAARATCTALSTFGSSTADTPAWRAHSARSSACSGCVGALIRTNTRACEFSLRKTSRLSRASRFRSSATASSRSTITTSAPVASALGMRSGRVAGTNSAVRMMFEFMVVPFVCRFGRGQSELAGEGEAVKLLDRRPSGSYRSLIPLPADADAGYRRARSPARRAAHRYAGPARGSGPCAA